MPSTLQSLIESGTKLWLDSVDPKFVAESQTYGATGATSNPIIIAELIKTGCCDQQLTELMDQGLDDEAVAWQITDLLVRQAQDVFASVYVRTDGDDGYVSFELDPLLEDVDCTLSVEERTARYVELGKHWFDGQNRMIKVPATQAGLGALEELVAAGVTVNITLLFTTNQYYAARDAVWRGAQRCTSINQFKSVYSIFVSRIDVYTRQHVRELSADVQGLAGIVTAKRVWHENQQFWSDKSLPLKQEIIFASTGTKDPSDPPDRYIEALAGSDIQTNSPATNAAIQALQGKVYTRSIHELPATKVLEEIDAKVDFQTMENVLMREGLAKFAEPQKALLALIAEKRALLLAKNT